MTREVVGTILVLLVFATAAAIAMNQRRKRNQQESVLPALASHSEQSYDLTSKIQYVATVFSNEPLRKVTAYGLGPRGHGRCYASDAGLLIQRDGEVDLFIPKSTIQDIGFSSATIDRGVERKGLVSLQWMLGEVSLTTQLRFENATERDQMLAKVSL